MTTGWIIAVVGLDSSGKSAVIERLAPWLEKNIGEQHADVRKLHYGYARGTLATSVLRAVLAARRRSGARGSAAVARPSDADEPASGWFASVRFLALAYERRRLLADACQAASRCSVVVVERWYSLAPGKMDSPRLDPASGNAVKRLMARCEHHLYNTSPDPDLVLHLQVDEAVAIERNRARTEASGDTDEQIRHRFRLHSNLPYRCERQVAIDNNGEIETTLKQVMHHTSRLLENGSADRSAPGRPA